VAEKMDESSKSVEKGTETISSTGEVLKTIIDEIQKN